MYSKYKAKRTEIDGIKFASKKEANRYLELKLLERVGVISNLQTQVPFELIPRQKGGIRNERACTYYADFVYTQDGVEIIEDTKGFKTDTYLIKRKLMKQMGKEITEL